MSEEIICLSSSDDEDACKKNSANERIKSKNATRKRHLSDTSNEDKNEVKKQKINNGVINIHKNDEDSKPKSNLNTNNKKSVKFESITTTSENKRSRKRSPSPVAGTSKYFDLIEKQVPKNSAHDKKKEKLPSIVPQNSNSSKKVFCDQSEKKNLTPTLEKSIKRIQPQLVVKEKVPIPDPSENIFEKILETSKKKTDCKSIEIVLEKVKGYYDKLEPTDKNCDEFRLFLNGCLNKIANAKFNQCLIHLVDVKMEIIRRIKKKNAKADSERIDQSVNESEEIELTEEEGKKVRKLEKVIKLCKKRIERLENQEVDFDEEDNSSYIMVDRYKKKIVELCEELSKIAKDRMLRKQIYKRLLRRKDIPDEMTGIIFVDDAIIRFVNSSIKQANELKHIKNPNVVAAYLFMPDYVDILQCIKQCNEEKNLELKNRKMEKLAEKAFKAVGNYLKNQRLQETKDYLASFVENSEGDPAKFNQDLNKKLKNNKEIGTKKLEGIFAKFVAKQEGISSESSGTENEENNSYENESNEEDNSTNKKENIPSSQKEDISSSPNKDISSSLKENISSNQNEDNAHNKDEDNAHNKDEDNAHNKDEDNSFRKDKRSILKKKVILTSNNDNKSEKTFEKKESCKENNESNANEVQKENCADAKSNTLEETSNTKKLTNFSDIRISITHENEVKEQIQPKTIKEAVTILSEICEISNSLTSKENKLCCESVDDEIQILSDDSDTNKENNEALEKESSQNIVLEIEDEDSLSITENNVKEDSVKNNATSDVNCTIEKKKKQIEEEKFSDEIQNKRITTSKNSNEKEITETDLKDDNDNDSNKFSNENSIKVSKKTNIGKVYPLQARDNHKKLNEESDQSKIADDSKKEETHISNKKASSAVDEIVGVTRESSFLKVKSFAKPPESWKDMSPEKSSKNPKLSIQQPIKQVLQQMSNPECVDLTNESEIRSSSSTRIINPLALKKRRIPVNKLVIVKNVVNNLNFSLPADGVREKSRTVPLNKVQLVNPQVNKSILISKTSCVQVNQVPPNNHNQRSNEIAASIVRTPFVMLSSTKKKNDNSNSPSTVK